MLVSDSGVICSAEAWSAIGRVLVDRARDLVLVNDRWCRVMGLGLAMDIDIDLDVDADMDVVRAVRRAKFDAALRRREETMPGYIGRVVVFAVVVWC